MKYIDNRINQVISKLDSFTFQDFKREVENSAIDISEKSLARILTNLINHQFIVRTKRNQYQTIKKNIRFDFDYEISDFASEINQIVIDTYPLVEYQIWELTVLNHFLNHLIGQNCIFVEVESDLVDTVFELLLEKGYRVLLNPSEDMYFRYAQDNIVVVRKLISQAPENLIDKKKISLERLLVDIVADKLLKSLFSYSEIPGIFHECLSQYNLNVKKVLRYASRRKAKEKIKILIEEEKDYD